MVVAEGMGDEHCQASGAEKSHRRTGTTARRDYASHVEGWNRVPLDKGNGADNLSDERQTVGATIQRNDVPRGTMDETSSLWTLVSIALPRSVREFRLFRLFLLIPCWESQRLIPKRSAGPRATKIGVVSLKALDHHRPNREESFIRIRLQSSSTTHLQLARPFDIAR